MGRSCHLRCFWCNWGISLDLTCWWSCWWSQYWHSSEKSSCQVKMTRGVHKNGYISGTINPIELKLSQNLPDSGYYAAEHLQGWQGHDDITMGANNNAVSRKWENTVIFMLIITQDWYITWKDTPFVLLVWFLVVCMNVHSYSQFIPLFVRETTLLVWQTVPTEAWVHCSSLPPWSITDMWLKTLPFI